MILREFSDQKARRAYLCVVCHKPIKKGMDYKRHYTQGASHAIVMHSECHDVQLMKEVFTQ